MMTDTPLRLWRTGESLPVEEKRARNTSTASDNKIHDDAVAREYGFRGGLVPGATTYAYVASYLSRTIGPAWAAGGAATVSLVRPVYEGEVIRIGGEVSEATGDTAAGSLAAACWADGPDGARCAPVTATLCWPVTPIEEERPAFSRTEQPPRPPEDRGPLTVANAPVGVPLPPVLMPADATALADYLDGIDEADPLFREASPFGPPLVHPGWWPSVANRVVSGNFLVGPWIHTRSEIRHLRPALPGGTYRGYGEIVEAYEKRGHQYATVDVLIADGQDTPIVRMKHTAIVVVARRGSNE